MPLKLSLSALPASPLSTPHTRQYFLRAPSRIIPSRAFSFLSFSSRITPNSTPRYYSSLNSKALLRNCHYQPLLQHNLTVRTMSSAPVKKEFLCILPDFPGAQAKRLEVRPSHLEGVKPLVAAGTIVAGGAMLESHPAEGETPAFKGSMMLAIAENEAEVRAILENDIYAHSGVWDLANAQIIPFKSAVRKEL